MARLSVDVSRHDLVVFNSGHWDLRSASLDTYVTEHLPDLFDVVGNITAGYRGHVVWRTSPPFGLQKSAAIASRPEAQSREYRTNEKISRGNSVATGLAQGATAWGANGANDATLTWLAALACQVSTRSWS